MGESALSSVSPAPWVRCTLGVLLTWMCSVTQESASKPLSSALLAAFLSTCSKNSALFLGRRPWVQPQCGLGTTTNSHLSQLILMFSFSFFSFSFFASKSRCWTDFSCSLVAEVSLRSWSLTASPFSNSGIWSSRWLLLLPTL